MGPINFSEFPPLLTLYILNCIMNCGLCSAMYIFHLVLCYDMTCFFVVSINIYLTWLDLTWLMVVIICGKCGNNQFRTENVTERTWFSKSRSNDLEDIVQGQRSSHATHLLMLVIICTKYGKNPSWTVDATKRTRFSKSRPNDLENIGQGQRPLHATLPLMLMMICAKYGKNANRIVDFFSRWKPKN